MILIYEKDGHSHGEGWRWVNLPQGCEVKGEREEWASPLQRCHAGFLRQKTEREVKQLVQDAAIKS